MPRLGRIGDACGGIKMGKACSFWRLLVFKFEFFP